MYEAIVIKSNEKICNIIDLTKEYFRNYISNGNILIKEHRIIIKKNYFTKAAEAFADFIIRDYVFFLVYLYLYEWDFEFSDKDRNYITKKVLREVLNYKNHAVSKSIKNKLLDFSNDFCFINIDGFMRFSMREYDNIILDLADIFMEEVLCKS